MPSVSFHVPEERAGGAAAAAAQKIGVEEGRTSEIATFSKTLSPVDQAHRATRGQQGDGEQAGG